MPAQTKAERLLTVHRDAVAEFSKVQAVMRDERKQCLEDRRFYSIAGAQWEGTLGEQFENRPKLEVNKIHLALLRIINEYRNNRITVKFVSKDGSEDDELADVCAGLFRADEHDSGAEEAYDNGFEEAVGGGYGAIRLRAVYEDEEDPDDDRQRIRIEPIFDGDTCVFFDLDAKRQDKSDAKRCWVIVSMTRQAYEEEWKDEVSSWDKDISGSEFDWAPDDKVFVAEYYKVEEQTDYAVTYSGPNEDEVRCMESELSPERVDELEATGYTLTRHKRTRTRRVHKYIMSGGGVLEDCGLIAGKCIPVVPVYGKRWYIDGIERCQGHVRLSKDVQRLKNVQLSKLAEVSSLSSVEKPIFTPEQVAGYTDMWSRDNIDNLPYLLLNPVTDANGQVMPAGPLAYTKPPQIAPADAALIQIVENDIKDLLGNQQEGDKMVSNIAEKTVLAIQSRMDMQTFIYVSNFAKAIRRVGEVWLSMAKDVYVEDGRTMKTMGASPEEIGTVVLNKPVQDSQTGKVVGGADLTRASFDVAVEVGPSSDSRREGVVRSIVGMLQATQDPETVAVLLATAIVNMNGEGLGDVREYFRKRLVKMGAAKPNEEEAQQMAEAAKNAKPDANEAALRGMAEESEAKAMAARADVVKKMADVEKTHAETLKIMADLDMSSTEKSMALIQQLLGQRTQQAAAAPAPVAVPAVEDMGGGAPATAPAI